MSPLTNTPVHIYAKLVGVVLTLVGIAGLFVTTSMDNVEKLMGFDVNLFHNIVHLATGLALLAVARAATKTTALVVGVFSVVYLGLAIWGLVDGGEIDPLGLFGEINRADHVLHLGLGLLGVIAIFLSRDIDALEEEDDGEYGDEDLDDDSDDEVVEEAPRNTVTAHVDSVVVPVVIPVDQTVEIEQPAVDHTVADDEDDLDRRPVDEV